jgi:hypothetical protein
MTSTSDCYPALFYIIFKMNYGTIQLTEDRQLRSALFMGRRLPELTIKMIFLQLFISCEKSWKINRQRLPFSKLWRLPLRVKAC